MNTKKRKYNNINRFLGLFNNKIPSRLFNTTMDFIKVPMNRLKHDIPLEQIINKYTSKNLSTSFKYRFGNVTY